mmetsp:Transcript_13022/g.48294  ORF Transcript_13022/g.48294 Transcript_13022/m.48294 type:complete len:115 (-) Transcript_13022:1555-1899(-)
MTTASPDLAELLSPVTLLVAAVTLLALYSTTTMLVNMWRLRAFPGPTPLPLVGNILGVVREFSYIRYMRHQGKRYGGIWPLFVGHQVRMDSTHSLWPCFFSCLRSLTFLCERER